MSQAKDGASQPKRYLDERAWDHIVGIVATIPSGFEVCRFPSDHELIAALGEHGAWAALQQLLNSLNEYYANLIFGAVRTCCARPLVPERPRPPLKISQEVWAEMFEVPWEGI